MELKDILVNCAITQDRLVILKAYSGIITVNDEIINVNNNCENNNTF